METVKFLIGNDSADQGMAWASTLKKAGAFAVTRKPNGRAILQYIKDEKPDVVIVNAKMAELDATELLREVATLGEKPIVIVTCDFKMPSLENEAYSLGAAAVLTKPFTCEEMLAKISETMRRNGNSPLYIDEKKPSPEPDLECMVTDVIHQIGIPAHIKGYHYLRYAIMISMNNNEMINCITKMLYPAVADFYKTTPSRVERAIRHAIELAWDRGDVEVLNSYFGYTIRNSKGKPTNSEFIALIADRLRLQLKNKNFTLAV